MKTLYVSDLDGTLLRSNETTSEYTNNILFMLILTEKKNSHLFPISVRKVWFLFLTAEKAI